jgi:hypothetical protein
MQESASSLDQLLEGETASLIVDEALGPWNVARIEGGGLVLESPEIPVDPSVKLDLLRTTLLENLSGQMLVNGRFSLDSERTLRLQVYTNDAEFDAAVRDMAKVYAKAVLPETFIVDDDSEALSIDELLQESSFDEASADESAYELLASFFKSLEHDPYLKDGLLIDSSGTSGVIELSPEEPPILLLPDHALSKMDLIYPIYLFSDDDQLAPELEIALQANSIIRLGPDLLLGCIEDPDCLYLRIQLFADQFNPESVKEALGVLLSSGRRISALLEGSESQANYSQLSSGAEPDYLSRGGMQI